MLAAATFGLALSSGYVGIAGGRPAVAVRSADALMMSRARFSIRFTIPAHSTLHAHLMLLLTTGMNGKVWDFDAKKAIFDDWNPEMPRNYDNFNPFERNDEGQQCDTNGCFPGQSKGYQSPLRPDVSWAIQQEINAKMDQLKTNPKFNVKGRPGNFSPKWQESLGAPPSCA